MYWLQISLIIWCHKFFGQQCYKFTEGYKINVFTELP